MATNLNFQIASGLTTNYLTDSKFIKAGYIVVNSYSELLALPISTGTGENDGVIVKGSLAYISNDSTASNNGTYRYNGISWVKENDVNTTVPANAVFTDTTYTFTGNTNGFTVTSSSGQTNTVTVTPSITNNITGLGASGYLTKFDGTHTIANGPQLSAAISTQNQETKFLREDGTWAAPTYTEIPVTDVRINDVSIVDNTIANFNTDENVSHTSSNIPDSAAVARYIASRGENLLTNGTCLMGNNYNFSTLTYDGSDTYYAGGCFKINNWGSYGTFTNNEFIPVDVNQKYRFDFYTKTDTANAEVNGLIKCYDIDKKEIVSYQVAPRANTLTYLTQELKSGDTVIHVNDLSGWSTASTTANNAGILFWGYKNSFGYEYPPETYTTYRYTSLWTNASQIDKTNNTITLSSAWPSSRPTFPAGTYLSQGQDGSGALYCNIDDVSITRKLGTVGEWVHHWFHINGIQNKNAFPASQFPFGTAYVRVGLMNRPTGAGQNFKISTLSLSSQSGNSSIGNGTLTIQKNGTNIATFKANQSSNVTANISVPEYSFDGTYNASTNKVATVSTVNNAKPGVASASTPGLIKIGNGLDIDSSGIVNVDISELGLSSAMHFKGITTTEMSDSLTTQSITINGNSYTANSGDVVLYGDSEYVWTGTAWERLGRDSSFKVTQSAVNSANDLDTKSNRFVSSVTQNSNGEIAVTTQLLSIPVTDVQVGGTSVVTNNIANITIPAQVNADWNATEGVAAILHKPTIPTTTSQLSNDADFITITDVPITDVKVNGTSVIDNNKSANITIPTYTNGNGIALNGTTFSHADTSSVANLTATDRTYVKSLTFDTYGHVTGYTTGAETVTNTDRYVNSATFTDDSTNTAASPVKMTLTRAGSDTTTVTANIPKVSSSSAGVAPKGTAVSSQSQTTKFLREDGTWAAPSYTVQTQLSGGSAAANDATVVGGVTVSNHAVTVAKKTMTNGTGISITGTTNNITINHSNSVTAKNAAAQSAKTLTWGDTFTIYEEKYDAQGHITGVASYNMTMPSNPNVDVKQNVTLATTSKAFITGVITTPTGTAQALESVADTGVFLTTTAGQLNATSYKVGDAGVIQYNSTNGCLEIIV